MPRRVSGAALALALTVGVAVAGCGGAGSTISVDGFTFTDVPSDTSGPFAAYQVPSSGMVPTLKPGTDILVSTKVGPIRLGEVITFHPPGGGPAGECGRADQGVSLEGTPHPRPQPCDQPTKGVSGQLFIKRVVGLPGDTLSIRGGDVLRDGVRESTAETIPCDTADTSGECTFTQPITVPAGDYYLLGDNRGNSEDSRFFGPVPKSQITGVVVVCKPVSRYCTHD